MFTDAISDPALREFLLHQLQDPYQEPMAEADVEALITLILRDVP